MKVSREKTNFFKQSVEYLGFIVTMGGAKTDPEKVRAVQEYSEPKNLYELRSFLGLASYYRCFLKDFTAIARPLKNTSEASEDVILRYPDFRKSFDLTTDASAHGIGAVLSQENRPITMISGALKESEAHYATNERELLAIVWALGKLQKYLYGTRDINIYTDHPPFTFAVSDSNPHAKTTRWKAYIDEHNAKIHYTPGKENHVADALSRQNVNALQNEVVSDAASILSELSVT